MSSEHTTQPTPLPPHWQQRATTINNTATDISVLVQANLVGHEPYDLPAPDQHTPEPPTTYPQTVARFNTTLATATRHERTHHQLNTGYRAELAELADAAHTLLTG